MVCSRTTRSRHVALALAGLALAAGALGACGSGVASAPPARSTELAAGAVDTFGVAGSRGPVTQTEDAAPTPIAGISGRVVQIATSNSDTYALTSSGEVWAWGVGGYGELGDGTTPLDVRTAVEVQFPHGVTIASLPDPMPFDGGLAIDTHHEAWAWGLNADDDLCLPSGLVVTRPAKVPLPDVTLGTGARTHSMFVSDGALYACGSGSFGELGDGSTAAASTPHRVVDLPTGTIRSLTSSWGGSGALLTDGAYYDWGYDRAGQLGDGTTTDSSVPVHVHLPAAVDRVFQGGSGAKNGQTIALLANGTLWTWGDGTHGQLGDGTTRGSTTPIRITLPDGARPADVASGGFATYAIDTTGRLWSWGRDNDGQLGTGHRGPDETRPTATRLVVAQISSTAQNAAALGRS